MKKNKSQFTTRQEKKLRRRLKFMLWVNRVFTVDNVMAALCGISLGIAYCFSIFSFMNNNLLGGFGFLHSALWINGIWAAYLILRKNKKKSKDESETILDIFDLICKNGKENNNK